MWLIVKNHSDCSDSQIILFVDIIYKMRAENLTEMNIRMSDSVSIIQMDYPKFAYRITHKIHC